MSDDFDREAEREKLREKYERDRAKREASERMSELLLQGATMTNRHCPECHSPVFSYEGTEFCPTCQREVTEEGELAGEAGAGSDDDGTAVDDDAAAAGGAAANGETAGVDADGRATGASTAGSGTEPDAAEEPTVAEEPSVDDGPAAGEATTDDRGETRRAERRQPPEETRPAPTPERRPARVDPPVRREERGGERRGLDDAEAALVREITNLTRRAEETRDVGRKRDFFAAAREAAETLETVRRL